MHKFNPTSAAVSAYNQIDNGSFELNQNNATWPDGWNKETQANTTATFEWVSLSNARSGEHAVSISNPGGYASIYSSGKVPYDSAKAYTAVGFVRTANVSSGALLIIHAYDSAGTWIGEIDSRLISGTAGWTSLAAVLDKTNAPAGTAQIRVGVQMRAGSGTAYFDNIRLVEGDLRTSYSYDPAGNYVTGITNQLGKTVTMKVDANTGNVTSVARPLGSPLTYSYDYLNRLTATTYNHEGIAQSYTYGYKANGKLADITNPNGKRVWTFDYNELNQLKAATEPVSDTSVPHRSVPSRKPQLSITTPWGG